MDNLTHLPPRCVSVPKNKVVSVFKKKQKKPYSTTITNLAEKESAKVIRGIKNLKSSKK